MFKNLVIPIDLLDKNSIKTVISPVLNFVNAFGAKPHFIHIIPDFGAKLMEDYLPKNWVKDQKIKYVEQMRGLVGQHLPKEIEADYFVGRGSIYDEVIQYSKDASADLIIVSAVRPQLVDYLLGSNASKIVRHASVSVLVIRE